MSFSLNYHLYLFYGNFLQFVFLQEKACNIGIMSLDILDGLYCILFHLNIILNFNGLKCIKAR